ncbi:hypothetical protein QF001_000923 [Paraburkholderia youngii]|uniref:gp53 minor capsid family protein n=1 Tax=Paraburkholderia youngii TaxID=2782701 RepID=UPI003D1F950A
MPSLQAYQFRMPAGFAGDLQRAEAATIETQQIDPVTYPTAFGVPVKLVAGKVQPIAAADPASVVYGFNLRAYPIQGNGTDPLGTSTPPTSGMTDILVRGYCMVTLNGATAAAKNGKVYVRVGNASAGKPIGGIEAALDATVASVAYAGNTGNGTMNAPTTQTGVQPGAYNVVFVAATKFEVYDPSGKFIAVGTTGVAFANQVGFTITAGGTAFVAGDGFTVTVTANTVILPFNTYFTGPADAYGVAEVAFNL